MSRWRARAALHQRGTSAWVVCTSRPPGSGQGQGNALGFAQRCPFSPHAPHRPGLGLLRDVIDFDQAPCADDGAGALVHRGVCGALDALRDTYDALPDLLTQVGGAREGGRGEGLGSAKRLGGGGVAGAARLPRRQ